MERALSYRKPFQALCAFCVKFFLRSELVQGEIEGDTVLILPVAIRGPDVPGGRGVDDEVELLLGEGGRTQRGDYDNLN